MSAPSDRSSPFEPVRTGVIGIGNISAVYLDAIDRSPALELVALASRDGERAIAVAQPYGARGGDVEALLADESIELIVDLTPAVEHDRLNERVIRSGRHLYSEKPFSLSLASATKLFAEAERNAVLVGSAPDTFFGAAHQAARRAIDSGVIGAPVFGASFVGFPGIEAFHPNPAAFYRRGGEAPFDFGPYFITQWINLLGPVRQAYSAASAGPEEREIRRGPLAGARFPVEVATSFNTVLVFDHASVSLILSLDVAARPARRNDLYCTAGSIELADPNFFGGAPTLFRPGSAPEVLNVDDAPMGRPNRLDHAGLPAADYRGAGLVDLAIAIRQGKPHRTAPGLVIHVVEVMEAILRSNRERCAVDIGSSCERPAPVDAAEDALLIELVRSPFTQ